MSGSLVNAQGGARTRASGFLAGVFALGVLVAFGPLVAWLPIPALAAIVCLMAARMFQREALALVRERHSLVDFLVVVGVIGVAVEVNLAAAAGAGVALSILLFLREQVRAPLVRRAALGDALHSKRRRGPPERAVLEEHGSEMAVFELQGSLFFGTADRLFREIEPHLSARKHVILDLGRIRSVDLTAAATLRQIAARLAHRGGSLVLCDLPGGKAGATLPSYLAQLGLTSAPLEVKVFPGLDEALEWGEGEILARELPAASAEAPLALGETELFAGFAPDAIRAVEGELKNRALRGGERVFGLGEREGDLYLVRAGSVRIVMPLANGKRHSLATLGRGDFFGEIGFMDGKPRTADAIASEETSLYALSPEAFRRATAAYPNLDTMLFARLAHVLAGRLRVADLDIRALKEM